jgi:hypothetical protein
MAPDSYFVVRILAVVFKCYANTICVQMYGFFICVTHGSQIKLLDDMKDSGDKSIKVVYELGMLGHLRAHDAGIEDREWVKQLQKRF